MKAIFAAVAVAVTLWCSPNHDESEAPLITPQLEVGDIVFTRIDNPLYRQVAAATGGWTSHVGVIVDATPGAEVVAESAVPISRLTPLRKFVSRSYQGMYGIKRLNRSLTDAEKMTIRRESHQRLDIFYHTGFKYDSKRQYCSKFVYDVMKIATGAEVGELQTIRELRNANPAAGIAFWRVWYFGFIPWERRMVTPASQWHDPDLVTVTERGLSCL